MNKACSLQNKPQGLILLEGAILSTVMLAIFLTVLGFTEHLNLLNSSNQILNQELNSHNLSLSDVKNNTQEILQEFLREILQAPLQNIWKEFLQDFVRRDRLTVCALRC